MNETPEDMVSLQELLDRSYAQAGPHLLEVITPERRLDAEAVAGHLQGMCLLVLATSTRDGRPITGPVDGIFHRGSFHFGSSPESVRYRHIAERPAVSASHLPSEQLQVTVHGNAAPVALADPANAGFRQALIDAYVPRYGEKWLEFLARNPTYMRIDAERMFTFWMSEEELAAGLPE